MNHTKDQFKATVNDEFIFEDVRRELDIVPAARPGFFHIIRGNKSYHAEVLHVNHRNKSFTFKINGTVYDVRLADQYDQLVNRLGLEIAPAHKIKEVRAPMPGLVLGLLAEAGQEIQEGDPLLILEAMKMENVLKAPGEGTIKAIRVEKGDAVEKNALLIELE